jgi:hypothetical protein
MKLSNSIFFPLKLEIDQRFSGTQHAFLERNFPDTVLNHRNIDRVKAGSCFTTKQQQDFEKVVDFYEPHIQPLFDALKLYFRNNSNTLEKLTDTMSKLTGPLSNYKEAHQRFQQYPSAKNAESFSRVTSIMWENLTWSYNQLRACYYPSETIQQSKEASIRPQH